MPKSDPSFQFKPGALGTNLKNFNHDIDALVAAVVDYRADKATEYMKKNAKWKDRTGNARATLAAYTLHYGGGDLATRQTYDVHEIHLHGGMPYQIWLEIRWAGKYAIIGPAVKYHGLALMNQLNGLVQRLGRGI